MKFIVLDISSKTGWAHFDSTPEGLVLLGRGQLEQMPLPKGSALYYPKNYLAWSTMVAAAILENVLIKDYEHVVIEETAKGSKDAHAQKILEWIHKDVAEFLVERIDKGHLKGVHYLQTGEWRQTAGCQMTKEEKKRNAKVTKARKAAEAKGEKVVLVEVEPGKKKVGKVSKKHVALRRVQEIFGIELAMKQNDEADALLIGYAAHERIFKKNI
jgi:hypothetical protein